MKKFNLKWLLLSFILSIASINQLWALSGTLYFTPARVWGSAWDFSTSELRISYDYNSESGNQWSGVKTMTKTNYTYYTYPVYSYTITSTTDWAKIFLHHYKDGVDQETSICVGADDAWIDFSSYVDKVYNGWTGTVHEKLALSDCDTQEEVTLYYAYKNDNSYTVKANMVLNNEYTQQWKTIVMSSTGYTFDGKTIYSCNVTIYRDGLKHLQFQRYDGDTHKGEDQPINNTWTSSSTFKNKIYVNGANKWYSRETKRTYDGSTYIYWKTSGNDIPGGWASGGSSNAIQLLKIENGNYTYQGFQDGDDLDDGFYRYLVPAGDYADVVEIQGGSGSYTGEFGFPSESEKNEIWNYKASEGWANWAHTYFAKDAYVYFDNTNSEWSTASGYNYLLPGGGGYSALYEMSPIGDTKLLCHTSGFSYNDFLQLVFIHTGNEWSGSSGNPDDRKASADYRTASLPKLMDHSTNLYNLYIPSDAGAKASSEASLSHSSNSGYAALLHSTQTVNIEITRDNGSSWITAPKAPAKVTLHSFALTDATTSAASNATDIAVNATTVETSTTAVRTATTTVAYSNMKDGYTFIGWYKNGSSQGSGTSVVYYPTGATAHTARFKAHRYNIAFDANSTRFPGATGSMDPINNVACDVNQTLTANGFTRTGYAFAGWATTSNGDKAFDNEESVSNLTYEDGTTVTLFALWEPVALEFKGTTNSNWNTASNWDPACVPTIDHDVTIAADVTVNINNAVAKTLTIDGGVLTIPATGALEVAGAITNTEANNIVIKSSSTNQGALIFNSTGSTKATVELTMQYADPKVGKFQMVAIPIPYVDVSAAFAGTGAYTFAWKHGTGWDQRGYYDGFSSFEAVLVKGKAATSFSGSLESTSNYSSGSLAYDDAVNNGDVHMFGNSWTAPIRMTNVSCTNATISILDGSTQNWDGVISGELIPALQGYAVVVGSIGGSFSINYTNAVRTATTPNEPLHAPQRYADEDPEPIIVYVSGNEMRTRIRLFEDETRFSNELDEGWEAYYLEGEGLAGEMYAIGQKKMNVLAKANLEGTVVGFVPGEATNYTISFAGDGKGYYFNDVKTGKSTLIDEANTYEFTSDESTNATRFVISKIPMQPTGVEEVVDGTQARKQLIDGALYIIRDGRIYTATGNVVK